MGEAVETPNKRVPGLYLLTSPRSCSNLLKMMMSRQPHVKSTAYFFFDPSLKTWKHLAEKDWNDIPESDRQALFESYQQCYEKMREKRAEINGTVSILFEVAPKRSREQKIDGSVGRTIPHQRACRLPLWTRRPIQRLSA